ncbi:NADH:ubiquinone reductase (Na(+)-transporting) subunit F [Aerosticca soli]|uniref:Phenol hydroxylase, FAD-and [2Fe-2S]-containing reductase component DmpP n=1 Tax=Aerosticca soli TaxID=2010829 RepID=A0A2Z6E464_9GAMM|nr:2Fe-2S iron-sulfur cluster binding domain-containing protein [Aerosticca soli]MDI3261976.1 2Fe-2S iron-sulfur cluster binding domain-containing protein [Fulvimonas sp.]BBD79561.1 phenol hydroxylase, FAD- and [2Fe-2S]-containing reductase component DmpP [Aerosticca soli]
MTYRLTIEPLGQDVAVDEQQTLLDAALRAGIYLPHACCHGLCGTCKVQLLEGSVDDGDASSFALLDFERAEGHTLACVAKPCSDVTIEADVEIDPDARVEPVADYIGTVAELRALSSTARGVVIELDRALTFQAGKYINLHLPGVALPRAFSLANPPAQSRRIELHVRRVEGGEATTFIHEHLKPGDRVRVSGPYGRFFIRKSAPENILLFAAGTGLSSIRSMLLDLLTEGVRRQITLFYGQRHRAELYLHEELQALAETHDHFHYVPCLSRPLPEDHWQGAVGHVHEVAAAHFGGRFAGHKAYLCGPPGMVDACITTLMRGRLFERDIYTERFIDAADATRQLRKSPLFKVV